MINVSIIPEPVAVFFSWDGTSSAVAATENTTAPLTSRNHPLNVTCVDGDGVAYEIMFRFLTVIVITLESPSENTRMKSGVTPVITFSNTPAIAVYSWDGATAIPALLPLPAGDGELELRVSVENTDPSGTEWFEERFTFTVDDTAPEVTAVSIANNSRVNTGKELIVTLSENCSSCEYSWDGGAKIASWARNNTLTVEITPFADGPHGLNIEVVDDLGNARAVNYTYVVDNTAIAITLNDPANGTTVEAGSPVNITFSEEPFEVYHNWDNATENATGYAGTAIPWGNGTHLLRLYVSDGLNWNDVAFVFEAVDPLIVITLRYPVEGLRTTSVSLEELFNVTFSETAVNVSYSWNGSEGSGVFTAPVDDGYYILNITVTETSGETATLTRGVTIDNSPPEVIAAVPDITRLNGNVLRVNRDDYTAITLEFDEEVISMYYQYNGSTRVQAVAAGTRVLRITFGLPSETGVHELGLRVTNTLNVTADYTYYIEITGTGHVQDLYGVFAFTGLLGLGVVVFAAVYAGPLKIAGAVKNKFRHGKE